MRSCFLPTGPAQILFPAGLTRLFPRAFKEYIYLGLPGVCLVLYAWFSFAFEKLYNNVGFSTCAEASQRHYTLLNKDLAKVDGDCSWLTDASTSTTS